MSSNKRKLLSATSAAGVTVVALSGFVPQVAMMGSGSFVNPLAVNSAQAAKATVPLAGIAASGITLTAPVASLKFGSFVATAKDGTFGLTTAGAVTSAGAKAVGNKAVGKFVYSAAVAADIDVKVSKMGEQTLAASANVTATTGKINLHAINFGTKLGAGALNVVRANTLPATTTAKVDNYVNQQKTADTISIGGQVTWKAAQNPDVPPRGSFSVPGGGIVLTIAY